jgi:endonuclease/exonuclease/phosphatase family metal-dependent hydrolase
MTRTMEIPMMSRAISARAAALFLPAALAALWLPASALLSGCGSTKPEATAPAPPAVAPAAPAAPSPAMTLRVASLDLSGYSGRIEKEQVDELARLIGERKIELLAVQGITRYPTVRTRTDLVDELSSLTGMRQAFGETINLSGRQSGNAVFSVYPITSNDTRPYTGVSGSNFEGALRAVVDAGTRPLVVVSTLLPQPLSERDATLCAGALSGIESERGSDPLIVLGNLPRPAAGDTWKEVRAADPGAGRLWYTPAGIALSAGTTAHCGLGTLLISDVDIFPRTGR